MNILAINLEKYTWSSQVSDFGLFWVGLLTLLVALFGVGSYFLNKSSLESTLRPVVYPRFVPDYKNASHPLSFVVENVGKSVAKKVKVDFINLPEPNLPLYQSLIRNPNQEYSLIQLTQDVFKEHFDSLVPGQNISSYLWHPISSNIVSIPLARGDFPSAENIPSKVKVKISYEWERDVKFMFWKYKSKKNYEDFFTLDIKQILYQKFE